MKRVLHLLLITLFAFTVLGVSDNNSRYEKLGHEMVCQCGCGQILLECNHVGCPVSGPMQKELREKLDAGLDNKAVLDFFIGKYGPVVLAAPIRGGFDLVAWIVPIAVTLIGAALVLFLISLWKRRSQPVLAGTPASMPPGTETDLQSRIRRETDYDSWNDSASDDVNDNKGGRPQ